MTQWCFNTLISNGWVLETSSVLTDYSEQTEEKLKIKVITMRAECSYFGDEQIHKKHQLQILMTTAAKELTVKKIKPP